jgi:pyruvate formate lyase activating enzyme
MTGKIFNIQEYSVNDGEGIRTTIFLKGCPLKCMWCSNPEGQRKETELFFNISLCEKCGDCKINCDKNAVIKNGEVFPKFERELCNECTTFKCVEGCTKSALRAAGEIIDAKDLYKKIIPNNVFFVKSGGGITLSGGEPLNQPEFVYEFLKLCKETTINTGVETCGLFQWEKTKDFIRDFNFIYFDIKCIDNEKHKLYTGSDNSEIIRNLYRLSEIDSEKITVSIPVVPGFNSDDKTMDDIAELCIRLQIKKIRLLPYHNLGQSKYEMLGKKYLMESIKEIEEYRIERIKNKFENYFFECKVE